ncbi:MAG TPA: hypothetical protein DCG85_04665 [Lachnospiraceae bacterium]|nr:hypothetical protein [Lachnospiraceae bacterium]
MKKSVCLNKILMILFAVIFFVLSGCSEKKDQAKVPELIDPVSTSASYRPVTRRVTGLIKTLNGTVVPTQYACFSPESVVISDIKVAVGDTVKEGDVIAKESDVALKREIDSIKDSIASLEREREKTDRVHTLTIAMLYYRDHDNPLDKEYLKEVEDHRYKIAVIDERLRELKVKLKEKQDKTKGHEFTAPHSGVVVYVKDMSAGNSVEPYENIVVIADMDDLYIECREVNIKEYKFADYKSKWIMYNGVKTDIIEYPYSDAETAYAAAAEKNPAMRFLVPGKELNIGDEAVLYFMNREYKENLCVGSDSIYSENGEDYVYVRADGDVNVKRVIKTGESDGNYTEVLGGISENDMVFYKNNKMPPSSYDTMIVSVNDYSEETEVKNVNPAMLYYDIYLAEGNGSFKKKTEPKSVKEGDILYEINYISGKAVAEEGRVGIEDLDLNREAYLKSYEKSRKAVIDAAGEVSETVSDNKLRDNLMEAFRYELAILDLENEYDAIEYEENKKIRNRDYSYIKKENVSGLGDVKARSDGNVDFIRLRDGHNVKAGDYILTVLKKGESDKTRVYSSIPSGTGDFSAIGTADLGGEIRIEKNGKVIGKGRVIGISGDEDSYILFTRDDKQYSTYSRPFEKGGKLRFIAEADESLSANDLKEARLYFDGYGIKGVITVPAKSVHSEKNQLDGSVKRFVWKIENDMVVKEYIQIYETKAPVTEYYVLSGLKEKDVIIR